MTPAWGFAAMGLYARWCISFSKSHGRPMAQLYSGMNAGWLTQRARTEAGDFTAWCRLSTSFPICVDTRQRKGYN